MSFMSFRTSFVLGCMQTDHKEDKNFDDENVSTYGVRTLSSR